MTTISANIEQYEQSCAALRRRIALLNDKIYGRAPFSARESQKSLEERRRFLYAELAEMEEAIARMRDYADIPAEDADASAS